MTCPKAGDCDLQRYAADLGIRESSFGRKSFNYELNDKSPFITIDNNYCVLCGRCVRVCKEQGTNVLDFMGRGITTKVSTAQDKPLHESGCTFCGSCVEACPVNTIMERDRWQHGREWDLEKTDSVCTACGSGCSVVVSKKDGRIVKVNTKESNGYICAIGRFGFDSLKAGNRITTPMKKQGGKLVPTTWEEAAKIAGDALKKAGANAGFIAAGSLTNEEATAVQKLAAAAGSANIDTPASVLCGRCDRGASCRLWRCGHRHRFPGRSFLRRLRGRDRRGPVPEAAVAPGDRCHDPEAGAGGGKGHRDQHREDRARSSCECHPAAAQGGHRYGAARRPHDGSSRRGGRSGRKRS